jgi:hypothetical protein
MKIDSLLLPYIGKNGWKLMEDPLDNSNLEKDVKVEIYNVINEIFKGNKNGICYQRDNKYIWQ